MDLFIVELSDMHSAEQTIAEMLGRGAEAASNTRLKQGLRQHQQETQQQADNIKQVFRMLGQELQPVRCYAAEGMMQSLQEKLQASQSDLVKDGVITGGSLKTENFEIASYVGLVQKAQLMGQADAARLLQQNLAQEQRMYQQSMEIGQEIDRQAAQAMGAARGPDQMGTAAQP